DNPSASFLLADRYTFNAAAAEDGRTPVAGGKIRPPEILWRHQPFLSPRRMLRMADYESTILSEAATALCAPAVAGFIASRGRGRSFPDAAVTEEKSGF